MLYNVVPPGSLSHDKAEVIRDTATPKHPEAIAFLREDGEFALVGIDTREIWSTDTAGNPGSVLRVQDDRRVALYTPSKQRIWGRSG